MSTARRLAALALAAALPALGGPAGKAAAPAPRRAHVVLVGWDGADWKLLDPLLRRARSRT